MSENRFMATLQEEQQPVDREIVNGLIAATPGWWKSAVLEIERTEEGNLERFRHNIYSSEGHKDIVEPTGEIYDAAVRLADVFRRHGRVWRRAKYSVRLQPDDSWKFEVEFGY